MLDEAHHIYTELPRSDWRTRALCGNRCDFGCHGNRRVLCARAKIMSGGSPANAGRASRSRAALSPLCLNFAPPSAPAHRLRGHTRKPWVALSDFVFQDVEVVLQGVEDVDDPHFPRVLDDAEDDKIVANLVSAVTHAAED